MNHIRQILILSPLLVLSWINDAELEALDLDLPNITAQTTLGHDVREEETVRWLTPPEPPSVFFALCCFREATNSRVVDRRRPGQSLPEASEGSRLTAGWVSR
jgi:hypothetical protein